MKYLLRKELIASMLLVQTCLVFNSCKKEEVNKPTEHPVNHTLKSKMITDPKTGSIYDLNPNRKDVMQSQGGRGLLSSITDASGQVEVRVWEATSDVVNTGVASVAVSVDQGFVVVGGAARATDPDGVSGPHALLIESRPLNDGTFSTWVAKAKDHAYAGNFKLKVFVIGMRLNGVSPSTLISNMTINESTSGLANSPNTSVSVPLGYKLIGGGTTVNQCWYGNLLVRSEPDASLTTWSSSGKDHKISCQSSVVAYAIGIKPTIPGFGNLELSSTNGYQTSNNSHVLIASANISQDHVLTCIGANSTFTGKGRMLYDMYPQNNIRSITASSKDHDLVDVANAAVSVTGIQLKKQ